MSLQKERIGPEVQTCEQPIVLQSHDADNVTLSGLNLLIAILSFTLSVLHHATDK